MLDKCTLEGKLVRKSGRDASATALSGFLFAFPVERLSLFQMGKQMGQSRLSYRFSDGFLPERGLESGDMRTTSPRFAEKKSVYCGKRRALLRKANGVFAGILVKTYE